MTEILNFRDRPNLEHIRENLFKSTEYGRVAVMIGAGFSRNAEKFSPQVPDFPLAGDLGNFFYSKLHPEYDFSRKSSDEEINFEQNFDKYASEFEKKFGKGELYSLLIKSIPDEKYLPGEIHELLLSLPWSDVFTTNYDTLLERTLIKIYDKKYDIIKTVTQIPLKSKPRIVKLHGDIPSNLFIITEEDYHKYKEKFGAFQNLVQQSILENVFCLIGFRGNDKNFKLWKKWVKDNLGEHSPPIFLCGILDLNEQERIDLENDNIKLVDLGSLFPKKKFIDTNARYKIAIEWFLKSLAFGEPNNKLNWPERKLQKVSPIKNPLAPSLCPIPEHYQSYGNRNYIDLDFQKERTKDNITNNCEIWRLEREAFPGWILVPKDNRRIIWETTKSSIRPIIQNISGFEFPTTIQLLYELCWRLEICLVPLFSNVANCVECEIKKINPFSGLIILKDAPITPDKEEFRNYNWELISTQWIDLAYSLIRHYRESNNLDKYQFWMAILEKAIVLNSNWKNKWYYEKCTFSLFQLNQEDLRQQITAWTIDDDHPEYQLKKSGLLAELGDLEKAKTSAEHTLKTIRQHIHSNREDFYLLSLEGWCLLLLQSLDINSLVSQKTSGEYRDRWKQLARFNCDPWIELEKFKANVSIPKPQKQPEFEIKQSFDLGVIHNTHYLASEPVIAKVLPAFAFLKMTENVGLPLVCGRVFRFEEEISYAADWIENYDPIWSMSIIARSSGETVIKNKFQRLAILQIEETLFSTIYNQAIRSLKQSLSDYYRNGHNQGFTNSFSYRQISTQMELLSRLSIRLSDTQLEELLDITINIYNTQKKSPILSFYDGIGNLFNRVSRAISQNKIFERMEVLLNLPIPMANYFTVPALEHFPEPFEYLHLDSNFKIPSGYDRRSWDIPILKLIQMSEVGTLDERRRSLLRLVKLFRFGGLSETEVAAFKEVLWLRTDPISELPIDTGYLNYVLLTLPELKPGDVKNKYRKWLINQAIPISITRQIGADGKMHATSHGGRVQLSNFVYEWLYSSKRLHLGENVDNEGTIDWSEPELLTLFNSIQKVWDEQKTWLSEFKEEKHYFYHDLFEQVKEILLLFEQIILFNLDKITNKTEIERILKTLAEFPTYDLCINSTIPGILIIKPDETLKIVNQLRAGLFSSNSEVSKKSIEGVYNYAILSYHKKVPPINEIIISDFVYSIVLRKEPGLSYSLDIASDLIKNFPELFNEQHINDLLLSLESFTAPLKRDREIIEYSLHDDEIQLSDIECEAIQRNVIELASSLQQYFIKKETPVPDLLEKFLVKRSTQ